MELPPHLKTLYPHLSADELREVEESIDMYLRLVLHIYDRLQIDSDAYQQFRILTLKGGTVECCTLENTPSTDNPQGSL